MKIGIKNKYIIAQLLSKKLVVYRLTVTKKFTFYNKFYHKLDKNIDKSIIYFIPDNKKQIDNWSNLIKKEKKLKTLYLHKVSILCKRYKEDDFEWKNIKYIEITINKKDIKSYKIISSKKV
jgi:hypothetical protein